MDIYVDDGESLEPSFTLNRYELVCLAHIHADWIGKSEARCEVMGSVLCRESRLATFAQQRLDEIAKILGEEMVGNILEERRAELLADFQRMAETLSARD